jgi:hypothetical protein
VPSSQVPRVSAAVSEAALRGGEKEDHSCRQSHHCNMAHAGAHPDSLSQLHASVDERPAWVPAGAAPASPTPPEFNLFHPVWKAFEQQVQVIPALLHSNIQLLLHRTANPSKPVSKGVLLLPPHSNHL